MALLSKKDILAADDIRYEDVPVPEWGGSVRVRGLTGTERSLIEATMVVSKGQDISIRIEAFRDLRERLVAACLVDDDGKRLFADGDVAALGAKSGAVLEKLFRTASKLSGMERDTVDQLAGNSDAGPSGDSGSD